SAVPRAGPTSAVDSLADGGSNGGYTTGGQVSDYARQNANEQRRRRQQADGNALPPDRVGQRGPLLAQRAEEDRAKPPQDVASRDGDRAHTQNRRQWEHRVRADEGRELGHEARQPR